MIDVEMAAGVAMRDGTRQNGPP